MTLHSNLGQFILSRTNTFGDAPAFILKDVHGGRRPFSFREFNNTVLRISSILQTKFTKPGFKIALLGENRTEWCALALATWHAGGTLVPLMHIASDVELQNVVNAARVDTIFISPKLGKTSTFGVADAYSMDFTARSPEGTKSTASGLKTLGDLINEANITHPPVQSRHQTKPSDLAILIFTSGTTGNPKGVMLTHQNIITNILDVVDLSPGKKGDRPVSVLPLSHMFELVGGFAICHVKGMCISTPDSIKPEDIISEMKAHKATVLAAVPLMFEIMDRTIQERLRNLPAALQKLFAVLGPVVAKYPSLGKILFGRVHAVFGGHVSFFVTGGAKIDPEVIWRFQCLGIEMFQGYGLTETSPIISFTNPRNQRYGTVGKIVRTVKLRIADANDAGEGEICVSGPSIFVGYFENEEATKAVLRDGWFQTGDIGRLDEEGFLFITGRMKDIIVTPNGKNVYPEEIEDMIKSSPLFTEAAVLGVDSGRGESVHVVVVPSAQVPNDPQEAQRVVWAEIENLTKDLSDYKRVQGVTLTRTELPKTPTKKVRKHLLRQMIKDGALGGLGGGAATGTTRTPLDERNDKEAWLAEKLREITKRPEVFREATLRQDMGLDSLTFMEVICAMETQWGVLVPDEMFEKILTVADLLLQLGTESSLSSKGGVSTGTKKSAAADFDYRSNNTLVMNALRPLLHLFIIRPLLKILFSLKTKGEKAILHPGSNVLVANHSSHLDVLSVLSSIPLSKVNSTYSVAADDYFFNTPWKALFVRLFFNAIPFDRKARIEKGFKICEDILSDGRSLVIFPEGTRSVSGRMAPFRPGVGRLVASRPYAVTPIFISGAYDAYPKGNLLPRMKPVSLIVGRPEKFTSLPLSNDGYHAVAERLEAKVSGLASASSPR